MKTQYTNTEIIDQHYKDAGDYLRKTVPDWSDLNKWRQAVNTLYPKHRAVYLIGVLNQQVMNGGFIQYFDNAYGMFGYDTLRLLKTIGASQSAELLERALRILNKKGISESEFSKLIAKSLVSEPEVNELQKLDTLYYNLESTEDLESLLGEWIKTKPNKN